MREGNPGSEPAHRSGPERFRGRARGPPNGFRAGFPRRRAGSSRRFIARSTASTRRAPLPHAEPAPAARSERKRAGWPAGRCCSTSPAPRRWYTSGGGSGQRPELTTLIADPARPLPLADAWRLLPAIVAEGSAGVGRCRDTPLAPVRRAPVPANLLDLSRTGPRAPAYYRSPPRDGPTSPSSLTRSPRACPSRPRRSSIPDRPPPRPVRAAAAAPRHRPRGPRCGDRRPRPPPRGALTRDHRHRKEPVRVVYLPASDAGRPENETGGRRRSGRPGVRAAGRLDAGQQDRDGMSTVR